MTHGNGKSFFNMVHTLAELLMIPAYPRSWAQQESKRDLDIYIERSKSSSFKSIHQPASHTRAQWEVVGSDK